MTYSVQHLEKATSGSESLKPILTNELADRLAEQVSYGPGGVRGLLGSPYVFGAAFLASLGGFSSGYDEFKDHRTMFCVTAVQLMG